MLKNHQAYPAFEKAIQENDWDKVIQIVAQNKEFFIDAYGTDDGNRLMHMAINYHGIQDLQLTQLAQLGCSLTILNNRRMTPLHLARERQALAASELSRAASELSRAAGIVEHIQTLLIKQEMRTQGKIYFTPNLALTYEGRTPAKKCDIPDQWEELDRQDGQTVSLHKRLAMIEALVVSETDDITKLKPISFVSASSRNYATANIGFVVSNKKHEKRTNPNYIDHTYKRVFITIPVDDVKYAVYRGVSTKIGEAYDERTKMSCEIWDNPHSEITLYNYLMSPNTAEKIVVTLNEKLLSLYSSFFGHKVYAIIIDIHTSRDMCTECEKKTYALQQERTGNSFLSKMESVLSQFGYVLPKEKIYTNMHLPKSQKLHCATRVSSYMKCRLTTDHTPAIDQENNRNIKKFGNSVIVHTDSESPEQYKFYNAENYRAVANAGQTFFSLPKQTVFANTNTQTVSILKKAPIIQFENSIGNANGPAGPGYGF